MLNVISENTETQSVELLLLLKQVVKNLVACSSTGRHLAVNIRSEYHPSQSCGSLHINL